MENIFRVKRETAEAGRWFEEAVADLETDNFVITGLASVVQGSAEILGEMIESHDQRFPQPG